MAVLLTLM